MMYRIKALRVSEGDKLKEEAKKGAYAVLPSPPKRHKPGKIKNRIANAAIYIVLSVISLIWILPVAGIVIESFYCSGDPAVGAAGRWGFDNYVRLFRETLFLKWFGNTLLIGGVTVIVQTAFQLSVGYVLSRFRFKGRRLLMNLIFVIGMFPSVLTLVAVNGCMKLWGLTGVNAPYGAILYYAANSGMGYFVAKGFFDSIDRSVTEAAEVDGATQMQIFFKIFLPTAKPIVIYTLFTEFLMPWSNFSVVDAVLPGYTVADGLQWILTDPIQDSFSIFCAGGVVISVPIVILFMVLLKYYVAGETIRVTGKPLRPVE